MRILDTISRESYRKADISAQIGDIEIRRKNYEEALDYYNKALVIYLDLDDNVYVSNSYLNIGDTYLSLNNNVKAKEFLEKGLKIGRKYKITNNIWVQITTNKIKNKYSCPKKISYKYSKIFRASSTE